MMWVIDASVALKWFLEEETHPHADAVLRRLIDQPGSFAIPELFCFEVFSVLARVHPRGQEVFLTGVMPLVNGGLLRQAMTDTLAQHAAGFVGLGLTGYDACYAALALELQGCWLTFDEKAHRTIAGKGVSCNLSVGLPGDWQ